VVAQTGKHFPGGFFFHGYVRILGFEALADIIINPMQQFFVNVSIDPLNLAGVFVVQRSASDSSLGPIVTIDVKYGLLSLIPKVRVLIAGYVNLLGISAEVEITVDNSGYHLFLESKFLGLFRASIWVDASYGSLESVSFRVRAEMEQDFFAAINKKRSTRPNAWPPRHSMMLRPTSMLQRKKWDNLQLSPICPFGTNACMHSQRIHYCFRLRCMQAFVNASCAIHATLGWSLHMHEQLHERLTNMSITTAAG